jgi:hypothetical protein
MRTTPSIAAGCCCTYSVSAASYLSAWLASAPHSLLLVVHDTNMMAATRASSVLDVLHRGTVFLLAGSTVYFTVEIGRAWWHLQATKVERQQQVGPSGSLLLVGSYRLALALTPRTCCCCRQWSRPKQRSSHDGAG